MAGDRTGGLLAALLLGCVGVFAIMAGPIVTEALVADLGLTPAQAGNITAAEALGTALGPVAAIFWMGRVGRRTAAIVALLAVIAGNLVSTQQSDAGLLAGVRFLVGLIGEGTAFALAVAIVAGTAEKDRNFAFLIAAQVTLGVLMFLLLPMPRGAGLAGVLLPLAGFAGIALLTVGRIAEPAAAGAGAHGAGGAPSAGILPIIALLVMVVWCTGLGAIWFFIKLIGAEVTTASGDVDPERVTVQIGQALAISTGVATIGAFTASWLGDRIGRIIPVAVALIMQMVMVAMLQGEMSLLRFTVTAAVFQSFWNLTGPYVMGTIALADTGGRISLLMPTAQIGGFFLGPLLAGIFLSGTQDYGPANMVAIACFLVALALFIPTALRLRRP